MEKKYILTFPPESINEPITYNLIKDYNIEVNILKAQITSGKEGKLLLKLNAEPLILKLGLEYLSKTGIDYIQLKDQINFQDDKCIHCGSCTAVCFSNALSFEKPSWEMVFNSENCIACGLCVKACPLNLFCLEFGG